MGRFSNDTGNIVTKLMVAQGIDKFKIPSDHKLEYKSGEARLSISVESELPVEGFIYIEDVLFAEGRVFIKAAGTVYDSDYIVSRADNLNSKLTLCLMLLEHRNPITIIKDGKRGENILHLTNGRLTLKCRVPGWTKPHERLRVLYVDEYDERLVGILHRESDNATVEVEISKSKVVLTDTCLAVEGNYPEDEVEEIEEFKFERRAQGR